MKREAKLLPARAEGITSKGLSRLHIESHPRQGLELFGALPEESLMVQLGSRRNVWMQEVLQPNPRRREPRCPHYGPCGGCTLQHLEQASQLSLKSQRIYGMLPAGVELLPPLASPQPFHYRTKVEFSFARHDLGFHRRGCFDRAVNVERCWIAPPAHHSVLNATRQWQAAHQLSGWDARSQQGDLRYLLVRQANNADLEPAEWLALLVTRAGLDSAVVEDWAARQPESGGLLWVEQTSTAGAIVAEREHLLRGPERIQQKLGELTFRLGWRSFFQSNPPAYRLLLDQLRGWLAEPASLLDLYCGIGSIGLYVAPPGCRLVGVENVAPAIEDARRCAQELGRSVEFHVRAAEDWEDWDGFEAAIVDPPRGGCHPRLVQRLVERGPREVFYVSCNPERFVAELAQLKSAYRLEKAVACDFFPQTAHVELLGWLRRL
ncbi:MAG: 23S rRNA (uracil(1939)-C(5))-methyltransferase RlmD [Vulcanimicrobiota bacterium]